MLSFNSLNKIRIVNDPQKLFIGSSKESKFYIESFSPSYKSYDSSGKRFFTKEKLNIFKKQHNKSYVRIEGITLEDKNLLEKVGDLNFKYSQFIFQVIKLKTGSSVFFVSQSNNNYTTYYFIIEGDTKFNTIGQFYPVQKASDLLVQTIEIHRKRGDIIYNNTINNDKINNDKINNDKINNSNNDWTLVKNSKSKHN